MSHLILSCSGGHHNMTLAKQVQACHSILGRTWTTDPTPPAWLYFLWWFSTVFRHDHGPWHTAEMFSPCSSLLVSNVSFSFFILCLSRSLKTLLLYISLTLPSIGELPWRQQQQKPRSPSEAWSLVKLVVSCGCFHSVAWWEWTWELCFQLPPQLVSAGPLMADALWRLWALLGNFHSR